MIESSGLRAELFKIDIPGYTADIERLSTELSRLWNAFLRGQIIVFALAVAIYSVVLPIMGVRYALGIALMAGLAKFLPYIGPAITWIVMALVTYFQSTHPFGLSPLAYMAMVVISTSIIDWIIDTFITPRIMASSLKVHPAAILITALIAANLLGLLGVVIAAPFLATVTLLGRYIMRKMFDLDPWPEQPAELQPVGSDWMKRLRQFFVRNKTQVQEAAPELHLPAEAVLEGDPDKSRAEATNTKTLRMATKRSKRKTQPSEEKT
jgi:predicted PurR-regulated permease PerM